MQIQVTSQDEVTIKVSRAELALLDYAVGLFQTKAACDDNYGIEDEDRANTMEKQLYAAYCQLSDDQANTEPREGQIRVGFNGDEWLFHNGEWELGTPSPMGFNQ